MVFAITKVIFRFFSNVSKHGFIGLIQHIGVNTGNVRSGQGILEWFLLSVCRCFRAKVNMRFSASEKHVLCLLVSFFFHAGLFVCSWSNFQLTRRCTTVQEIMCLAGLHACRISSNLLPAAFPITRFHCELYEVRHVNNPDVMGNSTRGFFLLYS